MNGNFIFCTELFVFEMLHTNTACYSPQIRGVYSVLNVE